jgi:hypothetical protein
MIRKSGNIVYFISFDVSFFAATGLSLRLQNKSSYYMLFYSKPNFHIGKVNFYDYRSV